MNIKNIFIIALLTVCSIGFKNIKAMEQDCALCCESLITHPPVPTVDLGCGNQQQPHQFHLACVNQQITNGIDHRKKNLLQCSLCRQQIPTTVIQSYRPRKQKTVCPQIRTFLPSLKFGKVICVMGIATTIAYTKGYYDGTAQHNHWAQYYENDFILLKR